MKLMKYELMKELMEIEDTHTIVALYEIIINKDFDYIENLFRTKEEFKEFIEKYKEWRENEDHI